MRASARLIRVALALAYLAQVAPNAHAPSGAAPGGTQPSASRLSSSKLARSLSDAGRDLQQLRLVERARGGEVKAEEGAEAAEQQGGRENSARDREAFAAIDRTRRGFYPRVYEAIPEAEGNAAWSKCSLGSACARRLRLLRARLAVLGSSALPGRGRPTERPATASGARASRLQRRRMNRLWPYRQRVRARGVLGLLRAAGASWLG